MLYCGSPTIHFKVSKVSGQGENTILFHPSEYIGKGRIFYVLNSIGEKHIILFYHIPITRISTRKHSSRVNPTLTGQDHATDTYNNMGVFIILSSIFFYQKEFKKIEIRYHILT